MIESALRRDRLLVAAGFGTVALLAWGWTLAGAGMPASGGGMAGMAMAAAEWSGPHAALVFLMWWIMMVAMMLPGAAPLALLAIAVHRRGGCPGGAAPVAGLLAAGYLAVWGAFSLCATLLQWGLESSGLLSPATLSTRASLAGLILLGAGLYQLAPPKRACLRRCRSPVEFVAAHWRPGGVGAIRMGVLHGAFCLGCCGFLMGLLFAGGIMNPFWIGAIALYVLLEKLAPQGERLSRASGLVLMAAGALVLLRAV